jgi:hypothetical protein
MSRLIKNIIRALKHTIEVIYNISIFVPINIIKESKETKVHDTLPSKVSLLYLRCSK